MRENDGRIGDFFIGFKRRFNTRSISVRKRRSCVFLCVSSGTSPSFASKWGCLRLEHGEDHCFQGMTHRTWSAYTWLKLTMCSVEVLRCNHCTVLPGRWLCRMLCESRLLTHEHSVISFRDSIFQIAKTMCSFKFQFHGWWIHQVKYVMVNRNRSSVYYT